MSNMKFDALTHSGISIGERVSIPDGLIPEDANVEMEAKKAAAITRPMVRQTKKSCSGWWAVTSKNSEALALLSACAVREKAQQILALARDDGLTHFRLDLARLPAVAALVAEVTRQAYPTLDVPSMRAGGISCMRDWIAGRCLMRKRAGRTPPNALVRLSIS